MKMTVTLANSITDVIIEEINKSRKEEKLSKDIEKELNEVVKRKKEIEDKIRLLSEAKAKMISEFKEKHKDNFKNISSYSADSYFSNLDSLKKLFTKKEPVNRTSIFNQVMVKSMFSKQEDFDNFIKEIVKNYV